MNQDNFTSYCSGANRIPDFKGLVKGSTLAGVVADEITYELIELMAERAAYGERTFVDSGAFNAFRKGRQVDFEQVFKMYDDLVGATGGMITLVGPDVIGDQDATIELVWLYARRLRGYINQGVDLIMPVQVGELSALEVVETYAQLLGRDAFRVGFPSNLEAAPLSEIESVIKDGRVSRIHFLGMSVHTRLRAGKAKVSLAESHPGIHFSFDSNRIAAKVGKKRAITIFQNNPPEATVADAAEEAYFMDAEANIWDDVQDDITGEDEELMDRINRLAKEFMDLDPDEEVPADLEDIFAEVSAQIWTVESHKHINTERRRESSALYLADKNAGVERSEFRAEIRIAAVANSI
nr:hypothetical protein 8 [bacterium]